MWLLFVLLALFGEDTSFISDMWSGILGLFAFANSAYPPNFKGETRSKEFPPADTLPSFDFDRFLFIVFLISLNLTPR